MQTKQYLKQGVGGELQDVARLMAKHRPTDGTAFVSAVLNGQPLPPPTAATASDSTRTGFTAWSEVDGWGVLRPALLTADYDRPDDLKNYLAVFVGAVIDNLRQSEAI